MEFEIKRAAFEDADDIARVLMSSWRSAYTGLIPEEDLDRYTDFERRRENVLQGLCDERQRFYTAKDGGKACGMFMFMPSRDADMPAAADVVCFYAIEEYWGTALGRRMMDAALEEIESRAVLLWTLRENCRARRFYKKMGFFPDSEKKERAFSTPVAMVRYVLLREGGKEAEPQAAASGGTASL